MNIQEEYQRVGKPYQPVFPAEVIHNLDRQETIAVLLEVERIAGTLEECEAQTAQLTKQLKAEQEAAEALRNKLSKAASRKILLITILGAVAGSFIIPVLLTFAFGAIAYFAAFAKFGVPDLEKRKEENDKAADTYIRERVVPLQTQLEQLTAIKDDIVANGQRAWAIEVIGEELFFSVCIHDLCDLVKSRRADSLKEALNKYDDIQYQTRMKEMQEAAQRAAEEAAKEAKEQTKKLGNIEWNTFWTSWNTKSIKRNTKKR